MTQTMDDDDFEREISDLFSDEGVAAGLLRALMQLRLSSNNTLYTDLPMFGYAEDTRLSRAQFDTLVERLHQATHRWPAVATGILQLYAFIGETRTAGYVIPLI